ncbi:MAG: toll/interleukin-1 receptor domain-containing protein [Fusobacteriaceae bacterium]
MSELNYLKTDLEKISYFYNLLRDRATGKTLDPYAEKEIEFIMLRKLILETEMYRKMAPKFLLKTRSLKEFWEFIKSDMSTYDDRRKYLTAEFSHLLNYIEFGDSFKQDKIEVAEYKSEVKDEVEILKEDKKIFISHSSLDKEYAEELVELLNKFGISSEEILCTSVSGTNLKIGTPDFLLEIKKYLLTTPIFICLFSKNYLNSPICLCEMGAAWITSKEQRLMLTPETEFSLASNVVLGKSHGMKIDKIDEILEMIEGVQEYFNISKKSGSESNRIVERYLRSVKDIFEKKKS